MAINLSPLDRDKFPLTVAEVVDLAINLSIELVRVSTHIVAEVVDLAINLSGCMLISFSFIVAEVVDLAINLSGLLLIALVRR